MVTIFYARFAYLNPGVPLFLDYFQQSPQPGVQSVNVSECTPDEVSRIVAESSTVAIDQSIENASTWAAPGDFSIYRVRGDRPASFFSDILDRLWSADVRRLFMSNFDLHDLRIPALVEKMRGKVDAFSWMFEKRPLTMDEIPTQYRDVWLSPGHDPIGTWNLVRAVAPVRIEIPFSVGPREFTYTPPAGYWHACVPGAPYATRTLAAQSIRRAGLRCAPVRTVSRVGVGLSLALGKTLPSDSASVAAIDLQQRLQRMVVRSSAMAFVCGSGVSYATRKFFEIPALQAPMLAYPCVGFEDYGFEHGVNVIATMPEDAGENAKWLHSNATAAAKIACAGQELVRQRHSLKKRVKDFGECLRKLDNGKLHGAEFVRGRFEIH